MSENRTQERPE